jgi:hypothetical protein
MVKLTDSIKQDILIKVKQGTLIKDLCTEYNISRSSIQRIVNKYDIVTESSNNNSSESEKNSYTEEEDNDNISIINQLNESSQESVLSVKSVKQIKQPEKAKPLPKINNNFIFDIQKKLTTSPVKQEVVINNQILDKQYPEKKNLINQIKRYILEFSDKLTDIVDNDIQARKLFMIKLNELELHQLKILLDNIQFSISQTKINKIYNQGFFIFTKQLEVMTKQYSGVDIDGLTESLQANNEIEESLKELSCKYDISNHLSPEIRLCMAVSMTGLAIYQNNKIKQKLESFLSQEVDQDIVNKYSHL